MIVPPEPQTAKTSLMYIEGGLTLIAAVVAFGWPTLGSSFFKSVETEFARAARRKTLAVVAVGLMALLLRLAILPWCPVPRPFSPDDFSNVLAAETFASGRLTNPTPAMWVHFESIHITMKPTYMSMYFPGEGLAMAAGKALTGHPWYGVLFMSAMMCAGICWMLQAWLPPAWAFLGGIIAILRIALFSYWTNTYTGAGSIAALGGALVLGALPRFLKHPRPRYTVLMALGAILLANTRPYEGLLLCLPVVTAVGHKLFLRKNRPTFRTLVRLTAMPLALLAAAGAWMGYYNYRAFGSPRTLPYTVNRATYATAPYFIWQSERPEPSYHHASMRRFYSENEGKTFRGIRSSLFYHTFVKAVAGMLFFCGIVLLPPLLMLPRVLVDRRSRFLVLCVAILMVGMAVEIFMIPHYLAPFTAAFYALGLQAMRHLRLGKVDGRPVGIGFVRLMVTLCIVLAGVRLLAGPLHLDIPEWPVSKWNCNWYGPAEFGKERAHVQAELEHLPGKQLALVRYSRNQQLLDEWVYNAPDIDSSKVIWAREMDEANNSELINYYRDRQVWLVQPDTKPPQVSPYLSTEKHTIASAVHPTNYLKK